MLKIVVSSDHSIENEAQRINELLRERFDILHLRKPTWTIAQCRTLLNEIDSCLYDRIVIHDFYELYTEFKLHGIHLTGRHPVFSESLKPHHISCSCHSLDEVQQRKASMNYVFLSPIFDSISKKGYKSHFTYKMLWDAADRGVIDSKVIALGGITESRIHVLEDIGFGGYAMLGNLWEE